MSLLETIINELVDSKASLASPLLKTKVLATRIDNQLLLKWVNSELNGYEDIEQVPDYRRHHAHLEGTYLNGSWRFSNQALPTSNLPESVSEMLY